jgi:hypothetical protein
MYAYVFLEIQGTCVNVNRGSEPAGRMCLADNFCATLVHFFV